MEVHPGEPSRRQIWMARTVEDMTDIEESRGLFLNVLAIPTPDSETGRRESDIVRKLLMYTQFICSCSFK